MATKPRTPGQTATSFSCEESLLAAIDERAGKLGMNRSQYLAALARRDLLEGGPLILQERDAPAPAMTPKAVRYPAPKRKAS